MNQLESRRIALNLLIKIFNLGPVDGEVAFQLLDTLYLKRNEGLTQSSLADVELRLDALEALNLSTSNTLSSLTQQINSLQTSTNNFGPEITAINNILSANATTLSTLQTSVTNLTSNQLTINSSVSTLTDNVNNLSTALTNQTLFNAAEYGYTAFRSAISGVTIQSAINIYPDMATFSGGNANISSGLQFLDGANRTSWVNVKEGVYSISVAVQILNAAGTFYLRIVNSNSNSFITNPVDWNDDTHTFTVPLYLNAGNNMTVRLDTSTAVNRTIVSSTITMTKV